MYYSDSMIVLGYLSNKKRNFSRYVTARVEGIQKICSPDAWKYIPSHQNPADLASRPLTPNQLADSRWLTGPDFLKNVIPDPSFVPDLCTVDLPETSSTESKPAKCLKTSILSDHTLSQCLNRYAFWRKVVCLISYLFRFG